MNINTRKQVFEKFQSFMSDALKESNDREKLMLFYEKFLKEILQQSNQEDIFKITEQFSNFLVDEQYKKELYDYKNIIFQNVAFNLMNVPFDEKYKQNYKRIVKIE